MLYVYRHGLPSSPRAFHRQAFDALQALSHPGVRGSRHLLSSRFLLPGRNKDVGAWALCCLDCQRTKVARHGRLPVQRIDVPTQHFSHVHLNLMGPLPSVRGYTHMFTVVDRSTCWPAPYPVQDTSTTACINSLVEWISCFIVFVCLLSLRGHSARVEDRLPPPVQWHGGEDALAVQGSFVGTLLFFVLAFGAALGPPRPQERASGAVWHFFPCLSFRQRNFSTISTS